MLCLAACAQVKHSVFVTTGTYLGITVSENPATQLYEARVGYGRTEFAYVPGDTNHPGSVPDVMLELRMENILRGGLVYQRLAVGSNAVSQPGAALMFAKDANGSLNSNAIQAVTRKIEAIPNPPHLQ